LWVENRTLKKFKQLNESLELAFCWIAKC